MSASYQLHIDDIDFPSEKLHKFGWTSVPPDKAASVYLEGGWPVVMVAGEPHLRIGHESGFAAVSGPSEAVNAIPDLRESRRMTDGHEEIVLLKHDAHAIRRATVRKDLWLSGVENPAAPKRRVVVEFTIYGEGEIVPLPYGGSPMTWVDTSESWFSTLPLEFSQEARLVPVVASTLDDVTEVPVESNCIHRPGQVAMVFGPHGDGIVTLLLAAAVELRKQGAEVAFFDYAGTGAAALKSMLRRMGEAEFSWFKYVGNPPHWGPDLDLRDVVTPRTRLVVVNDLPGLFYAAGRTGRSAEHVLPVLDDLAHRARRHGAAVAVADRSKGRVPVGARVKLDRVDVAWLVGTVVEHTADRDGLMQLEGIKNAEDQLVALRVADGGLRVEFGADDQVAVEVQAALRERVRSDLIEAVLRHPRQVTRHELTNMANLAGSRDLRREVVEELEAEGVLIVVAERRAERGAARTRQVYVAKPQQPG